MHFYTFAWMLSACMLLRLDAARADVVLQLVPGPQTGQNLEIAITVSGLSQNGAPALGAYDLELNYDPNLLTYASAAFGDPVLGDQLDPDNLGLNITGAGPDAAGQLNLHELSLDPATDLSSLQAQDFTLAEVDFQIPRPGLASFSLTINALSDANGLTLPASTAGASVEFLPLPSANWAMAAGLGVIARLGRKSK